jgi:RNA polymerase sigma-70 factor (ECF subfamily)
MRDSLRPNRSGVVGRQRGVSEIPDRAILDDDLIVAVGQGDATALRTLYDRHGPWLTIRLARRCADRAIVEEVLQDTFLAVWRGASRFQGRGEVAAWIWGIAIRRLIDRLRRHRTRSPVVTGPDAEPSAEELVLLGIEHGDLASAINRLSPELRAVIQATALDGLTTREAAHLLGIPRGTVKTRLMRARRELREALA